MSMDSAQQHAPRIRSLPQDDRPLITALRWRRGVDAEWGRTEYAASGAAVHQRPGGMVDLLVRCEPTPGRSPEPGSSGSGAQGHSTASCQRIRLKSGTAPPYVACMLAMPTACQRYPSVTAVSMDSAQQHAPCISSVSQDDRPLMAALRMAEGCRCRVGLHRICRVGRSSASKARWDGRPPRSLRAHTRSLTSTGIQRIRGAGPQHGV